MYCSLLSEGPEEELYDEIAAPAVFLTTMQTYCRPATFGETTVKIKS
jgi:hypothetical protein